MKMTENQISALKITTLLLVVVIMWTSVFSVSAQAISDENSTNTETQVGEYEPIVLPDGDTLTTNTAENEIGESGNIAMVEGVTVDIKVGTKDYKKYDVPQSTVKDALEHANIELGEHDTVSKSLNAKVKDNTKIKVNRVHYKKKTKTEKLKFKTVEKETSSLYVGETKVQEKGKNGTKKVTYTSKVVNGKVKKTVVSKTKVTKKAKNKVVLVGTKRRNYTTFGNNPTSFDTKSSGGAGTITDCNGKKIAYTKVISGPATAYTAHSGARTSVGDSVHIGGVAVNPKVIPYGSKLYIESPDGSFVYGYAVANDTGGFIYTSNTIVDLYYPSYNACVNFGRRSVNVYVLA